MGLQGYVGNAADQARIRRLEQERQDEKERLEKAKAASAAKPAGFRQWEHGASEVVETAFKQETVGLVTRDEYIQKKSTIQARLEDEANKRKREEEAAESEARARKLAAKETLQRKAKLSFADDEDGEGDDDGGNVYAPAADVVSRSTGQKSAAVAAGGSAAAAVPRIRKNDEVATGFLPDAQRRRAKEDMRIQLKQEWLQEQEALKQRALTLRFSYWDGSGHQRQASVTVGDTVGDFLKQARAVLETDFPNLRHVTVPNLLLVKDDIMLPQATTFYAFLVGHAHNGRGKQLFDVDEAVDDQKMHSAKVVLRSWYESNKHIYPANRWELFDEMQHIKR